MAQLTADRNTPRFEGDERVGGLAASQTIFAGAILMRNAAGYLTEGATATGSFGAGVALERKANAGAAGAEVIRYRPGIFRFANSASGDLIAATDVGAVCYIVDDQTVAKTSGTNTRSPAGVIDAVDANGVWVRFDEALTRAMLS